MENPTTGALSLGSAPPRPEPGDLNAAADELIAAMEDTEALDGLRDGLRPTIHFYETVAAQPGSVYVAEAEQAARVMRALVGLAAAVLARREHHG